VQYARVYTVTVARLVIEFLSHATPEVLSRNISAAEHPAPTQNCHCVWSAQSLIIAPCSASFYMKVLTKIRPHFLLLCCSQTDRQTDKNPRLILSGITIVPQMN